MSSSKMKLLLVFIVIMIIITNIPRCNDRSFSSRSISDGSSNGVCLFIVSFLSFSSSLSLNSCYTHCSKKGFVKGINNLPSLLFVFPSKGFYTKKSSILLSVFGHPYWSKNHTGRIIWEKFLKKNFVRPIKML